MLGIVKLFWIVLFGNSCPSEGRVDYPNAKINPKLRSDNRRIAFARLWSGKWNFALYEDNGNDYGFKNGNFSSREIQ